MKVKEFKKILERIEQTFGGDTELYQNENMTGWGIDISNQVIEQDFIIEPEEVTSYEDYLTLEEKWIKPRLLNKISAIQAYQLNYQHQLEEYNNIIKNFIDKK